MSFLIARRLLSLVSEALPEYVERCEVIFKLRKHGVIFDDPLRVDIDPRAVIMPGVRIGANVAIIGESTQINAGAVIAGESRIIRSVIGTGSVVTTSFVEDSVVENDVRIGPFSRVRDQSRIRAHVVIGNFVEIKRSEIREGTRIHHQCYIGDTTVGKGVNIGAGVITANYDGERKHGTIIGDHAFIGCHATLRAPVSIGEGAIVGAGAVVLCNVEDGQTVVGIPAHPLSRKA